MPLVPTVIGFITLLGSAISFLLWATATLNRIDNNLSGRWTIEYQREFQHKLQQDNPSLKVPDSDDIRNRINR